MTTETEPVEPGVGFQAAVGVYVGAIAVGLASLALAVADASSGALLSAVPTVFTSGLVVGALAAWARPGIAERLGARRWRSLEATLPALAVGAPTAALYLLEAVSSGAFLVPAVGATIAIVASGGGIAAIARDVYIESITGEPAVEWPWKRAGPDVATIGIGLGFLAVGAVIAAFTERRSLTAFLVGAVFLLQGLGPALSSDGSRRVSFPSRLGKTFETDLADRPRADLRADAAGLVVEPAAKPSYRRLVPWERITDVRLTDEELVLERRWRPSIRCDRSTIDDPEAVAETLRAYVPAKSTAE